MIPTPTDEQLLLLFRDGDSSAFNKLYQRHKDCLFRYFLRQSQHPSIAEELAQDVWTGIIRNVQQYTDSAKFTTYLYRIAHNRFIDHQRRQQLRPLEMHNQDTMNEPCALPDTQPDQQLLRQQRSQQIKHVVFALPFEQREAFLLKEEAGLSQQEIADITNCNPETVKSRLRYAYTKLRHALGISS